MKRFPLCVILIAIGALLIGSAPLTARSTSAKASVALDNLSAATNRELARARNATAKYHDVAEAEADGYENLGYAPGEGFEYFNAELYDDCTFDAAHPEILHYVQQGDHYKLVGVEYLVPAELESGESCPPNAPEGFTGAADEWVFGAEGYQEHALHVWLWLGNSNGIFAPAPHPLIP